MGKTEYTMKRRALSNICTGLGTLGVYLLTNNWLVTALMVLVLSFFFIVLFTKNGFTKKFTVLFAVLVIILIALMCYFRFKPEATPQVDNTPTIEIQEEKEEDPTDDQEVIVDETTEDTTSKKNNKKNWSYETLPDKETPTYSNTKDVESNKPNEYGGTGNSKVEGSTTVKVEGESQTSNKETQAAGEAEKGGDKMENLNEGVIAGTKEPVKEETKPPVVKDEATKEDPNKNKVDELESAESKGEVAPPPSNKDEQIPLEEQVKEDLTDKELEDLFENTPKEEPKEEVKQDEVSSQPEHNQTQDDETSKEQEKQPVEDKKEEIADEEVKPEVEKNENETQAQPEDKKDVEEKNDGNDITQNIPEKEEAKEEVKEEVVVQPTKTPVTITPLDGNQAYAGDSVQFKLTGDVASVNGLDGLKYSMANGYLTVETNPNEATVLTITIVGSDGVSSATTSVTINVINVQ